MTSAEPGQLSSSAAIGEAHRGLDTRGLLLEERCTSLCLRLGPEIRRRENKTQSPSKDAEAADGVGFCVPSGEQQCGAPLPASRPEDHGMTCHALELDRVIIQLAFWT